MNIISATSDLKEVHATLPAYCLDNTEWLVNALFYLSFVIRCKKGKYGILKLLLIIEVKFGNMHWLIHIVGKY